MALKFSWLVAVLLAAGCSERRFVMTLESTDGTRASGSTRAHWSLFGVDGRLADSLGDVLAEGSEAFDVDIDGDGQFCGGEDMFEDWADFDDQFMHEKIPRRRDIPMAKLRADHGCEDVEP